MQATRVAVAALAGLALASCTGTGRATAPVAEPAAGPDGASLYPTVLVYDGHHTGDHPTWSYRSTMSLIAAERDGRAIWRRTVTYGDDGPMRTSLDVDRATLAPVQSQLEWNGATVSLEYAPGTVTGVIIEDGALRTVSRSHQEPVVLYDALDLYVAALPLRPGFETRVSILEFWLLGNPERYVTRELVLRVTGESEVVVPAGTLPVYVVALVPTDGDERLRTTYHVLVTAPHFVARAEYVVNPATVGEEKRSTGVEELVALPQR